jgi:hypothetical protein
MFVQLFSSFIDEIVLGLLQIIEDIDSILRIAHLFYEVFKTHEKYGEISQSESWKLNIERFIEDENRSRDWLRCVLKKCPINFD